MTPERWQQIREVLHGAMEIEPRERPSYLDRLCSSDPDLRKEVNDLLLAEQDVRTDFLESPPRAKTALDNLEIFGETDRESQLETTPLIGRRLGSYQIVEEIGSGGMGEVYRAFRADDQYRKQVAIKVATRGRDSGTVIERFKNERQILADMDHPNIARLLDGGATEAGDPFFVMEFIEGLPIDEYCDRQKLTISGRLELFCQVCSAVQYAHRHLIVHRDIKPSNVLVTSDGVPKLLDFGIAKILDAPAIGGQLQATRTVFRALTPGYASPEQVMGMTITTASDIYSLGVVLYELLSGRSPYRLTTYATHEIARAVCEIEPEKLSAAVCRAQLLKEENQSVATSPAEIAGVRGSSPDKLSKRLGGDLDNIVLMALRKEPQRRYESVEQFAQDIQRHLTSLPVMARTDTLAYRTTKFVNRHKAGVAAAVAVFLTLVVGMVVTLREAQIARSQETRAERNFTDVRALTNSLIFEIHDNIQELPGATKARKVLLDRALQYLDRLAQEAAGDTGLQRELASGYERLGDVQGKPYSASLRDDGGALQSYNKSLRLRQRLVESGEGSSDDVIRLAKIHRLIATLMAGDISGALDHAKKAVAAATSVSISNTRGDRAVALELAWDYFALGDIESGGGVTSVGLSDRSAALQDMGKALAITSQLLGNDPGNVSLAVLNANLYERIGVLQGLTGRRHEGLQNLNVAMNAFRSLASGTDNARFQRSVGAMASVIGFVLLRDGRFEPALASFREELMVFERLSKRDPHDMQARGDLTSAYFDMAEDLMKLGRLNEALVNIRRAITVDRELTKPRGSHTGILADHSVVEAEILSRMGDTTGALRGFGDARNLYAEVAQSDERNIGARLDVAAVDTKIGATLFQLGQYDEAQKSYRRAIQVSEQPAGGNPPNLDAQYTLADAYSGLGDIAYHLAARAKYANKRIPSWKEAASWYDESIRVWNAIPNRSVISPAGFDVGDPVKVANHLAVCKAALDKLKKSPVAPIE